MQREDIQDSDDSSMEDLATGLSYEGIVEDAKKALAGLKFGIFLTICRAPIEAVTDKDQLLARELLDDESVRASLAEKGALDLADQIKRADDSHWYLLRVEIGDAVEGDLVTIVGLLDDKFEDLEL